MIPKRASSWFSRAHRFADDKEIEGGLAKSDRAVARSEGGVARPDRAVEKAERGVARAEMADTKAEVAIARAEVADARETNARNGHSSKNLRSTRRDEHEFRS